VGLTPEADPHQWTQLAAYSADAGNFWRNERLRVPAQHNNYHVSKS
jgi:hypothetical protein